MTENFTSLIEKLKNKTVSKQAIWSKTSRDNEFKLELQKGAITIDSWEDNNVDFVDLNIMNENGEIIDRAYFHSSDRVDYKTLLDLHSSAKRAYFKVDETIKNIFDELDSKNVVGKERRSDDDDLLF
ncbi:MAG: hypothetical protein ACRYFA_10815 [Janthinobacterium lividum]